MPNFQNNDFSVREEDSDSAPGVVKTTAPVEPVIADFRMADLKQGHAAPAARGGAPAVPRRGQRFVLSQLARDALSISSEEKKLAEERMAHELRELSARARAEGLERGRSEGYKAGHDEAYQAASEKFRNRLESLDSLVMSMEDAKTRLFEANREFLMNVVYRVAKSVLLRELVADKDYLGRLARELIDRNELRENLTIRINPADAEAVESLKEGLLKSFSSLRNLSIELSDHVPGGGCLLDTEWSAIDASLETQLSEVLKCLDVPKGTAP